jgi:hypothetical protein
MTLRTMRVQRIEFSISEFVLQTLCVQVMGTCELTVITIPVVQILYGVQKRRVTFLSSLIIADCLGT